ncbi:MAG: ribose-phosphate pyrophosphokinase [Lachnospiraceae bacterium]|nr:ribose-phosphate pyrophosphokinase [Lachnospiraceae bacterium]
MSDKIKRHITKPVAPLKLAYLEGSAYLAKAVNEILLKERRALAAEYPELAACPDYQVDSYLLDCTATRYGTGEGRVRINETVRGTDLYVFCDITNYSPTFKVCGRENHMSPDNHFQDLKRIISAANGRAHRIKVIMPFLYEGRQHKKTGRESLDCALGLKELVDMGVSEIITFDAHDPRVMNAIPLCSFDNYMPTYQFMKALITSVPDLKTDKEHFMVVSPDEGAMDRGLYFSNLLGVDMGTFYKRRDYSKVVNGRNPIVAHEFLGDSVEGKDVVVIDDMISSGGSMLDVCKQLKEKGCRRVFICATFGLFTNGMADFDKYYEQGLLDKVICTNLTYLPEEILAKPYFETANMFNYLTSIINAVNHDLASNIHSTPTMINSLLEERESVRSLLERK